MGDIKRAFGSPSGRVDLSLATPRLASVFPNPCTADKTSGSLTYGCGGLLCRQIRFPIESHKRRRPLCLRYRLRLSRYSLYYWMDFLPSWTRMKCRYCSDGSLKIRYVGKYCLGWWGSCGGLGGGSRCMQCLPIPIGWCLYCAFTT